ncbi:hypothetical protein AB0J52_00575 [Spirillospora sp. NPDC049652]
MPISPPPAAQPLAEAVPYLFRFKSSLVKRWSHTRMRELYQEFDLATYLWSLNRESEAVEILDSITNAIPKSMGDYNIWCPVVAMHALQARILRGHSAAGTGEEADGENVSTPVPPHADDADRANPEQGRRAVLPVLRLADNVGAVVADPGLADNPPYIAESVTEAEDKFKAASSEKSRATACRNLSRALCPLFVRSELALARHPFSAYYDPSEPDRLIQIGRAALATRLTS